MPRFHKMADGAIRACNGCERCDSSRTVLPARPILTAELLELAYDENRRRDIMAERASDALTVMVGAGETRLSADERARRDAGWIPSVPMPLVTTTTRLDDDDPDKARTRARSKATGSCPEARYNRGMPRNANKDPNWGRNWQKKPHLVAPLQTSSRRLASPRLMCSTFWDR